MVNGKNVFDEYDPRSFYKCFVLINERSEKISFVF